jgi:hypothetical protein
MSRDRPVTTVLEDIVEYPLRNGRVIWYLGCGVSDELKVVDGIRDIPVTDAVRRPLHLLRRGWR